VSLKIYVICDVCSKGESPTEKVRREVGRGWCDGTREYAREIGWARVKGQDICPECVDEREDE